VSILAKRAVLTALALIGLALVCVGLWFVGHLGPSGSGTFTLGARSSGVVVLEPAVLNRVDEPVTVTATAADGTEVWIGRATPGDVTAIVAGADHTRVTDASVRDWQLRSQSKGAGATAPLAASDVWREERSGDGRVSLRVQQQNAPESVVVGRADGSPAQLETVTMTVANGRWFAQSLLAALVGLIALVAAAVGLWNTRPRGDRAERTSEPDSHDPGAAHAPEEVPA
jgi:hypothetical protein